jgi:hypothetical protein
MSEPTTMTEKDFGELMTAIDTFHKTVYDNLESNLAVFKHHDRAIAYIQYGLAGITIFNMFIFTVLAVKGII